MKHALRVLLLVAVASLALPAVGADDAGPAPETSAGTAQEPPSEPALPVPRPYVKQPSTDLEFDLLGAPAQGANPALERAIQRRRTMLTLHPALGIATWAALAATTVVGQLDFDDRFRGGGDTGKYHGWHTGLAAGSSALFLGTGLLALLAPKPFSTPTRLDTALLHKIAMGAATTGMLAQIVLGIVARGRAGSVTERQLASVHQALGYGTLAAYTAGMTVLVF